MYKCLNKKWVWFNGLNKNSTKNCFTKEKTIKIVRLMGKRTPKFQN